MLSDFILSIIINTPICLKGITLQFLTLHFNTLFCKSKAFFYLKEITQEQNKYIIRNRLHLCVYHTTFLTKSKVIFFGFANFGVTYQIITIFRLFQQ